MARVVFDVGFYDLCHDAQMVRSGREKNAVTYYDYGPKGNMRKYGTRTPPDYNLTNIPMHETKIALFSGSIDTLASPEDVQWMVANLPAKPHYWKKLKGYAHIDFPGVPHGYMNSISSYFCIGEYRGSQWVHGLVT